MTSLSAPPGPSPSRNPFARPPRPTLSQQSNSFTRSSLLPTLPPTPASASKSAPQAADTHTTPAEKLINGHPTSSAHRAPQKSWRMLYRGGLEIGPEGFRLDGASPAST